MTGNEIFWSSGTWVFFVGQGAVLLFVLALYYYQGRKERESMQRRGLGLDEVAGEKIRLYSEE